MKKISKRVTEKSYGIVVIRYENNIPLFLLLGSKHYFDFPKGRNEENESGIDAALRETNEEASIKPTELSFKWGNDSFETEPYKKGTKTATYWLAETTKKDIILPINDELGKPEHNEFGWHTYDSAKKILNERLNKVLDWAWNKINLKKV